MQTVLERVTPEEDGILRRLHFLEQLGAQLSEPMQRLKAEIRAKDLRAEIREPQDKDVVRTLWIT